MCCVGLDDVFVVGLMIIDNYVCLFCEELIDIGVVFGI